MRRLVIPALFLVLIVSVACARSSSSDLDNMKTGTPVTVTMKDGSVVAGRLVQAKPDEVVIDPFEGGEWKTVSRTNIASVKQTDAANTAALPPEASQEAAPEQPPASAAAPPPSSTTAHRSRNGNGNGNGNGHAAGEATSSRPLPPRPSAPQFREVTVPAGTLLHVRLDNSLASNTSHVEDPVRASLTSPVVVDEVEAVPAGSALKGVVTEAQPSGKVKGRASLGFRFQDLVTDGEEYQVRTQGVAREAEGTKKKDAMKIGIPAAGGAILGGILGGKKGAVIGGAVGGGAGTAVVVTTPGEELHLPAGTPLTVKLLDPLTVRVPMNR